MVLVATQVKRRRGTTAENDAFTGAEGEIVVDTERHELRVHDGVTQGGFKIGGGSGSGRNIGDIFYTTRTDTALAGAVECDGGTYNTEDYEGDGSIGELLEAGKLDYISLTAYATAISTKGWCDKIGWNGAGTTSFRVPTLTPHIIQTNNIPVVGNGINLGIKVGSTYGGLREYGEYGAQGFQGLYGNSGSTYGSRTSGGPIKITEETGKSGIIADTTDTAQLRVMFQLFNSTTDEAVATVGTVVAQVGELNSHRVIDFQIPTAGNGYTWYRKYADGWVEQGGRLFQTGTGTLPVEMADTNYNLQVRTDYNSTGTIQGKYWFATKETTSFTMGTYQTSIPVDWLVSGMAK